MKVKRLLVLLPVFALIACSSLGKEITKEEATAKAAAIEENQQNTNVFSFVYKIVTRINDTTEKREYKYTLDEEGNYMLSRVEKEISPSGVYKNSKTIYNVKLEALNRVFYVNTFDGSTNQETTLAYSSLASGSEELENAIQKQSAFKDEIVDFYNSVVFAKDKNMGDKYNVDAHYYTSGEGNLTTQISYTYNGEQNASTIKKITNTFKYSNNLFSSYNASYVTFGGNKRTEKATNSYKKIRVNLPADWEQCVITSVSI